MSSYLGKNREVDKLTHLSDEIIHGVEQKLWSEQDGSYLDIQESHHSDPYRILTQDVLFYLIAISQNTFNDSLGVHRHSRRHMSKSQDQRLKQQEEGKEEKPKMVHESLHKRAISTLDSVRNRVWKEKWPLVTETELKRTGPWVLKPYQYHNHTFWPWTTGRDASPK